MIQMGKKYQKIQTIFYLKNVKKTIIKLKKNLLEKIGEKIENSKSEISNILEEKIKNLISENDINKKEFIDIKSNPQDPSKVAQNGQTE
jgi:IMP dehydrogenase/GMP reductase